MVEILKLMLGRYSEFEIWSRFVFELVIGPKQVTLVSWSQPSGLLCLWQCFYHLGAWHFVNWQLQINTNLPGPYLHISKRGFPNTSTTQGWYVKAAVMLCLPPPRIVDTFVLYSCTAEAPLSFKSRLIPLLPFQRNPPAPHSEEFKGLSYHHKYRRKSNFFRILYNMMICSCVCIVLYCACM